MKPKKRVFEQVKVDEWLKGTIADIKYDDEHEFTYKSESYKAQAVKIFIELDGYKEKKQTQWMSFLYTERANLYKLFVSELVAGALPKMELDLEVINNMRIKVMYAQNGEYQNITMVRPLDSKVLASSKPPKDQPESSETDEPPPEDDSQVPF